jgi:hypothetical protein
LTPAQEPIDERPDLQSEEAPICEVHKLPMTLMHGRRGDFWSCHEKNADGSWCSYKPHGRFADDAELGVNRMT